MTCDDVFDALTRGPFPSGGWDDEPVEEHLAHCPACRRLATALQPALELFQEAIGPEESEGLPGYRGRAVLPGGDGYREHHRENADPTPSRADAAAGLRPVWPRLQAPSRGRSPRGTTQNAGAGGPRSTPVSRRLLGADVRVFRFAAAVLLGVAAAAGSHAIGERLATPSAGLPDIQSSVVTAVRAGEDSHPRGLSWLTALPLPESCTARRGEDSDGELSARDRFPAVQLASAASAAGFECCTKCHSSARAGLLPEDGRAIVARACSVCHERQ